MNIIKYTYIQSFKSLKAEKEFVKSVYNILIVKSNTSYLTRQWGEKVIIRWYMVMGVRRMLKNISIKLLEGHFEKFSNFAIELCNTMSWSCWYDILCWTASFT